MLNFDGSFMQNEAVNLWDDIPNSPYISKTEGLRIHHYYQNIFGKKPNVRNIFISKTKCY
jgi:hypothetical protein